MKKLLFAILIVALAVGTAQAGANRFGDMSHAVQVKDEVGRNVDDITNLFIYLPGTTTNATIYSDKNRQNVITIPMTEASANTTLVDGLFTWWGPDTWDFSMSNTDGVGPMTNAGHADRNSNEGTLVFPTYLQSISSTSYTDAQTITMGTGSDWVFNAGSTDDRLTFTPATTSTAAFWVGNASFTSDLNLFGDGGFHIIWDTSENTLELLDNVVFAVGTGDDYTITHNGSTTTVAGAHTVSGVITQTGDMLFDGTAGDISWDASEDTLCALDDGVVGFGNTAAAPDIEMSWNGTNLLIESAAEDTGEIRYGSTNAIDVAHYANTNTNIALFNANTATLEFNGYDVQIMNDDVLNFGDADNITVSFDGSNFKIDAIITDEGFLIGDTTSGFDITYAFETAGQFRTDYDGDFIILTDGMDLRFGAGASSDGDFQISSSTGNVLQLEQVVLDTGTFEIGVTGRDIPTKWWGETEGDFVLFTGDLVQFEDIVPQVMDDTTVAFGDGLDVTMQYDEDGNDELQVTGAVGFDNTVTFRGGQTRTMIPEVVLDGTVPPSQTAVGTSGQSQIPVYSFDANPNATGDDYVFILWRVPAGYVVDSADLFFTFSYSNTETDGDDVVFDITVLALTPGSGAAGGTAFDAAGTASGGALDVDLVNGDGDEGKIMEGTFDIEVTAIAAGDEVLIAFWVDESESDLAASGTIDIHKWTITYESTE